MSTYVHEQIRLSNEYFVRVPLNKARNRRETCFFHVSRYIICIKNIFAIIDSFTHYRVHLAFSQQHIINPTTCTLLCQNAKNYAQTTSICVTTYTKIRAGKLLESTLKFLKVFETPKRSTLKLW